MKKILLLLVLCLNISIVLGQEYKAWEKHDIEGIYIMAKSKDEAKKEPIIIFPPNKKTKCCSSESAKESLRNFIN